MAWYIYDEKGHEQRGPFDTRARAVSVLEHTQMHSTSHTRRWTVAYGGENKNESSSGENTGPLLGSLIIASLMFVWWLIANKKGRKVLAIIITVFLTFIAIDAWKNRMFIEKTYYENGNIKTEKTFKSKKLNGLSKFYLEDGKVEKEQMYKNGDLNGVSTDYYKNGNLKTKKSYQSGKLNGISSSYLESGKIEKEQTYKNDIKNGTSKIYYPSGALKSEAIIVNNKLNGISILYDEKGNILRKEKFDNDRPTNIIE